MMAPTREGGPRVWPLRAACERFWPMPIIPHEDSRSPAPASGVERLLFMLVGGVVATIALEISGQAIAPALGFERFVPEALSASALQAVFGPIDNLLLYGKIVHWISGVLLYPAVCLFIVLPVFKRAAPGLSWVFGAVAYGVVLWVIALYFVAHLVSGNPPFLSFTGVTWVALAGYLLYSLTLGAVLLPRT
ncbi:hypothetical protein RDV64_11850 [Acuticoccus sp. MNP-M23]|uniref:hypothetical protein n=1 Tax=Acuticoccus sp. MNP-M23 TaxID=3072793 RepID=UPI0028149D97|nr:hypothetical protein [Acuticoccus sp. MNP-M23]WMS40795.1 hypothetical protein RDV64_11850 [Acuticoccus sp. MNP-M23]